MKNSPLLSSSLISSHHFLSFFFIPLLTFLTISPQLHHPPFSNITFLQSSFSTFDVSPPLHCTTVIIVPLPSYPFYSRYGIIPLYTFVSYICCHIPLPFSSSSFLFLFFSLSLSLSLSVHLLSFPLLRPLFTLHPICYSVSFSPFFLPFFYTVSISVSVFMVRPLLRSSKSILSPLIPPLL